MSVFTVDIQLPRQKQKLLFDIFSSEPAEGLQLVSANLLYGDLKAVYFRLEIDSGPLPRKRLDDLLGDYHRQIQYRIREDISVYEQPLVEMQPARGVDFKRAYVTTSPSTLGSAQELLFSRREDVSKISQHRIALISDGTAYQGPHEVVPKLERDAYLITKYTGLHAIPIWLDSRNEEEFIKTVVAISSNYFSVRISDLNRDYTFEVAERISDLIDIPLIHAEATETPVVIAAMMENLARHQGIRLRDKTIGIIGLGPEGHGLKSMLAEIGVGRIFGIDADVRQLTRFEKQDGIASSIDHVYENADFVVISPGYHAKLEEPRFKPGQIILSFSPDVLNLSLLADGVSETCFQGSTPHPLFILPGLVGAVRNRRTHQLTPADLTRLQTSLTSRNVENSLLPPPSAELVRAQQGIFG